MIPASLVWRPLTAAQLPHIYKEELCRDFPTRKRKSLQMLLDTMASGDAHGWGVWAGTGKGWQPTC